MIRKLIILSFLFLFTAALPYGANPWGVPPWGVSAWNANHTWADDMLASYISLHTTLPAGVETELLSRLQPGGYLYTTFGPDGQDKSVCDFVLGFLTTGDITTRTCLKTDDALRWDIDGTVTTQDDLPAHTLGAGDGIVTVSTTDGWSGLSVLNMSGNPFTGQFPNLYNVGLENLAELYLYTNPALSLDISSLTGLTHLSRVFINGTLSFGDIANLAAITSMTVFGANSTLVSGDVSDLVALTGFTYLWLSGTSVNDVSGQFLATTNSGLSNLNLSNLGLDADAVDQVLADYVAVNADVGLDLTADYIINLGGTNSAPSASGIADYATLVNLFSATAGSMTITITGVGANLMAGWGGATPTKGFTTDSWGVYGTGSASTATTFTSGATSGGVYKYGLVTLGKTYLCHLEGDADGVGVLRFTNSAGSVKYAEFATGQSISRTFVFTAVDYSTLAFVNFAASRIQTISTFELYELNP
jgi:hypothetical protein